MRIIRRIFFWLHLVAGLVAGLVIFSMSVTGVLLTYERQMTERAMGSIGAAPAEGAPRLALGQLLAKAQESQGGAAPTSATWKADPRVPTLVSFGRDTTIAMNPYTGEVLPDGAKGTRAFFRFTTDIHRWLAMEGEKRDTGRALTGACNLAFLFLVLSGIYLWWPRQFTWKSVQAIIFFDRRLTGKARDWNWHNVLGFWSSLPLVIIVATGAVMSYPWANNLLFRLAGSEPPPPRSAGGPGAVPAGGPAREAGAREGGPGREGGSRRGEGARVGLDFAALDRLGARAEAYASDWRSISWRGPASFMIEQSHRGRPDLRTVLTLEPRIAEVVKVESFAKETRGRQWRLWFRWLHTGEAGGVIGQTIAGLASLAAAILVFTGIALSIRRLSAWWRRRSKPCVPGQTPAESVAETAAANSPGRLA